jgi:hypothetical protein
MPAFFICHKSCRRDLAVFPDFGTIGIKIGEQNRVGVARFFICRKFYQRDLAVLLDFGTIRKKIGEQNRVGVAHFFSSSP